MNKFRKTVLIILIAAVVTALAIGGYFIVRYNNTYIGKDAALSVAMDDAGIDSGMVYAVDVEFEKNRYSAWYEVDFEDHTSEYKYVINAADGKILSGNIKPQD